VRKVLSGHVRSGRNTYRAVAVGIRRVGRGVQRGGDCPATGYLTRDEAKVFYLPLECRCTRFDSLYIALMIVRHFYAAIPCV